MNIKVTIEMTTDLGDKMTGISGIESNGPLPYGGEIDNLVYYVKKSLIACGFGEGQVNEALRDSEEI